MVSVKQNSKVNDLGLVKTLQLGTNLYRIYELNTKKGLPYFLDMKDANGAVTDLGYFKEVGNAEYKAKYYQNKYFDNNRAINYGIKPKRQNGGGLSQHIDAAFDAAASGDRGALVTTKNAIRTALNKAKQPEGQKAREYIFSVLDIIAKNRSKWSGAQTEKAVREYSSAVYGKVLPKLKIKENPQIEGKYISSSAYTNLAIEINNFNRLSRQEQTKRLPFTLQYVKKITGLNDTLARRYIKEFPFMQNHTATDLSKNPRHVNNEAFAMALFRWSRLLTSSLSSDYAIDYGYHLMSAYKQPFKPNKKYDALKNSHKIVIRRNVNELIEKFTERRGEKNHTATDFHAFKENRSKEHFKMFQGKQSSGSVRVLQPDSAPKETSRLGDLVLMRVIKSNGSKQDIKFDGESFLVIDLRKNLWAIGKDARIGNVQLPRKGELKYLGKLKQIDYVTAKKHIGGNKLTRFWHELGEVDKNYPSLYVDADGFPIIHGGGYDVWNIGIVN